jgi:hypothetical protein
VKRKPTNARQVAFVESYLTCFNGAEAARRAGYSKARARDTGSELLQREDVQQRIRERLEEAKCGADEVLARLAAAARVEWSRYYRIEDGGIRLDLEQMQEDGNLHLITGWKLSRGGRQVPQFADPLAALELLGRHHGLFTMDAPAQGTEGNPLVVKVLSGVTMEEL